jgi:hypothetical protein
MIVDRWLATTIAPVRASPRLRSTVKRIVPFPLPSAADVSPIQAASGVAVQLQSSLVDILSVPAPPFTPML